MVYNFSGDGPDQETESLGTDLSIRLTGLSMVEAVHFCFTFREF